MMFDSTDHKAVKISLLEVRLLKDTAAKRASSRMDHKYISDRHLNMSHVFEFILKGEGF